MPPKTAPQLLRILDDFANFQTNTEIPSFGGNPREKKTAKEIAEKIKDIIQTYYYEIELNMKRRSSHNALLGAKGASKTEKEAELATIKAMDKTQNSMEVNLGLKNQSSNLEKEIRSITNSLKVSKKKTIWDEKEVLTNLLSQELDLKKKDLFSKKAISEEEKVEKIVNSIQQKDGSLDFSFLIDAVGKSIGGTVKKQILSMIQSVNVEGIKKILGAGGTGEGAESMKDRALRRIGAGEIDGATKTLEAVLKQKGIIDGMEEQREELNRRAEKAEAGSKAEKEAEAKKRKKARAKANKKDKEDKKKEEDKKAQDILDKEADDKALEKARLKSIADEEAREAKALELKETKEKRKRYNQLVQMALKDVDELTISKLDEDERATLRRIIQKKREREAQFGRGLTTEEYQAIREKESADFEARQARKKADADAQAKALQAPKVNERRAELFERQFGMDENNPGIELIKDKIKRLEPLDASDRNMLENLIKFDIQNAEEGEARALEILYQDLNAPPIRLRELIGQLAEVDRGTALNEITSGFIDDIGTGVADYDRIARATPRKVDRAGGKPIGIYDVGKKAKLGIGEAPFPSAGLLFDKQKKPLGIFPLDMGGMYPQKGDTIGGKNFYGGVPVSIGGKQVNIYHQAGTLPNQSLTDYGDAFVGGRTVLGADKRTSRDFGAFTQLGITATLGATGLANVPTQRFDEDQNPLTRSPPSYRKGTIKSYPLTNEEMNIQQRGNRYSLVRSGRKATYQNINKY